MTHQLDEPANLGPVLRKHATDADEIVAGLDALDDLLAAQSHGEHLVVEQGRYLERVFAETVDDPGVVAGVPEACGQICRSDRRRQRSRVGPRWH